MLVNLLASPNIHLVRRWMPNDEMMKHEGMNLNTYTSIFLIFLVVCVSSFRLDSWCLGHWVLESCDIIMFKRTGYWTFIEVTTKSLNFSL